MYKHLINSAANRGKAWLERIAIGDQDSVFELFVSAAIMTSITFTFLSPNEIVRFINAISTITLVGTLAAHFGRAFNRDALMAVSFCTAVFEMAVSVFYHGGVWSISSLWFLSMPLPVLMVMGLRAAIAAVYAIFGIVGALYIVEISGLSPPPIDVTEHLMWWWACVILLGFNIWVLPIIAHVIQQRILMSVREQNRELEKTQGTLDEETEQQDLFVASVSHELRTPMNAIMGLMQTLQTRAIVQGPNAAMFSAMNHSARHLLTVINDLLDFSQIQTNSLRVASRPMPLKELLGHFEPMFAHQLSERGIDFEVSIDSDIPAWVLGDPDRLTQIIINLLGNATKFTKQGKITLSALQLKPNNLRVEVTDTGCGIEQSQLHLVFERFSRLATSTQRSYGGTGLGLSISSNLIERMGGHIGVQSTPNEGSLFWFEIPLQVCAAPPEVSNSGQGPAVSREALLPQVEVNSALIVDDSMVNRLVAKEMLLSAFPGILITEADNGLRAIEALKRQRVEIILMDVIMPEMDGIEATRHILAMDQSAPPIIGLTADVTEGVESQCRIAGMVDILIKPYERQVLIQRVQMALDAARIPL